VASLARLALEVVAGGLRLRAHGAFEQALDRLLAAMPDAVSALRAYEAAWDEAYAAGIENLPTRVTPCARGDDARYVATWALGI